MKYLTIFLLSTLISFSLTGIQEAESSDECGGLAWTFLEYDVIAIVGTVISSEKIYYEEPQYGWDEYEYYYTVHKFSVDEIIKGEYLENEITLNLGEIDTLKVDNQYILLVGEYEGVFYGAGCQSIYDMNKYNTLKMLDAINDDNYNEDFIKVMDINVIGTGSDRTVIFVGYIDDTLKSESIQTEMGELDDEGIFIQLFNPKQELVKTGIFEVDENGFFSFVEPKSYLGGGDYKLLGAIFDEKPKIDRISFPIVKSSYSGNNDGEICKDILKPILKISDSTINCVNHNTRENLIDRNWGIWLLPDDVLNPYSHPEPEPELKPEEAFTEYD